MIKQLSVLVSNNPGNLFNVVEILKENNIECYGLSTYDATDFGVFHMKSGEQTLHKFFH